jgi:chemotaxis protein methyltransferase CheR
MNIKLKRLRDYLNREIGIFVEDEKLELFNKKLQGLLKKLNVSFDDFYRKILLGMDERLKREFVNLFTVNETYFFREKYQFDALVNYVLPELDRIRPKDEIISILCAPVSSGEELYSIAIYLMEEGNLIKRRDFLLLGIDIDTNMIEKAKKGEYSQRSVQKLPSYIIEKYFDKIGDKYVVKDFLKKAVNFKVANVLNTGELKRLGMFDVIFSRNMLIYFDEKTKRKVLNNFYTILKDEGYLFLGHAERIPSDVKLFKMVKIGDCFVYKKSGGSQ